MALKYQEIEVNRKFGVEMEIGSEYGSDFIYSIVEQNTSRRVFTSGWDKTRGNDYWHVKYDSTCGAIEGTGGWEIASFVGDSALHLREISNMAIVLEYFGVKTNNNCGLHYHICVEDLTLSEVSIILARWIKVEKLLFNCLPSRRITSSYCKPIYKNKRKHLFGKYSPLDFMEVFGPHDLGIYGNLDRRVSLNLVNYMRAIKGVCVQKPTIEFRVPEGTLNSFEIENWFWIFLRFVEFSLKKSMPKNLMPVEKVDDFLFYLGLNGLNDFFIFDDRLHKARVWLLKRMVMMASTKKLSKMALDKLNFIIGSK